MDPDGTRTVYLANTEIRWNTTTGTQVARTYGQTRREFDGTITRFALNHQGSIVATTNTDATSPHNIRYTPYGNNRPTTADGDNLDDRNFLGQPDDPNTPTNYLNNRHYQPTTGTFLSVDPIAVPGQPASLNPYVYSQARPTAMSDGTGLRPDFDTPGQAARWFYQQNHRNRPQQVADSVEEAMSSNHNCNYPDDDFGECEQRGHNEDYLAEGPESESLTELASLFDLNAIDMFWIVDECALSDDVNSCVIDHIAAKHSDISGPSLEPIEQAVLDDVLLWSGAVESDVCGTASDGGDIYCVAVTRLPTVEGASAVTIGHFILYDVTDDDFQTPGGGFDIGEDPVLLRHELAHVPQWIEHGSDFLWIYLRDPTPWECEANANSNTSGGSC